MPVELVTQGDSQDLTGLPADLDLAAYRIIQESLTNVLRHGEPNGVRVRVTMGIIDGRLVVDVTDQPGTAAELGGSLTAGPVRAGGWQVRAELPVHTGGGRTFPSWVTRS
ncbi:hypothetical protein CgIS1_11525 [Frankia sp. CgS1]|nr:hypothetical protein CgIS1_11525 [Frankia sp. CgIS1]